MEVALPEGGLVRGVGTDLVECGRIAKVYERQQDRFLQRVFTEGERAYCLGMKNPVPHLAARFAAKEAVSKCFTTGIGDRVGWRSVEVVHGERGQPLVRLDEAARNFLAALGGDEILLSLSHTESHAMACAVLVRRAS